MIKHIVMWKIKESANGMSKNEIIEQMKLKLLALKKHIPEIIEIEVGGDISKTPASFDVTLYSSFENNEDLEKYAKHPEHVKVANFIAEVRLDRVLVDYVI